MRNIKLFLSLVLFAIVFYACTKDDGTTPGGGNDKATQSLNQTDFNADLLLEDLNDGVDYIISQEINGYNDITIKPGVTIQFEENAGINISESGSIQAIGLEDKPIIFTGKIKSKGAWAGIFIESSSLKNQLKHCIVEFGGSGDWGNDVKGALGTWASAALNIDNCIFRNNKKRAISLYHSSEVDLRSFENNKFENNDLPIKLNPSTAHQLGSTNTFADLNNRIEIYQNGAFAGEINTTKTWKAQAIPYYVEGRVIIDGPNNLSIEAGTTIEFGEQAYFHVDDKASLTCKGTAAKPILLTGELKAPGSWGGIAFNFTNSSKNILEYTNIEYAGGTAYYFDKGAIYMWADPTVTIKNCSFKNINSCIFNDNSASFSQPNLTEENNTIINSGDKFCQ